MKNLWKAVFMLFIVSLSLSIVYSESGTNLADITSDKFQYTNDSSHMSLSDGKLSLENVTFNVPEGFEEDGKNTQLDLYSDDPALAGLRGSRCVFFNGDDYLAYMVMYSDIPDSNFSQIKPIEGIDSKYKTIADKEGVLTVENGVYTFIYPTDNGYVQIISNKEDLIGQAII